MIVGNSQGRRAPTLALPVRGVDARCVLAGGLAALLVLGLARFDGGYYPRSWGWGGLAALAVAVALLLRRKHADLSRNGWLVLLALALMLAWIGVSALRPGGATRAVPEVERG